MYKRKKKKKKSEFWVEVFEKFYIRIEKVYRNKLATKVSCTKSNTTALSCNSEKLTKNSSGRQKQIETKQVRKKDHYVLKDYESTTRNPFQDFTHFV